MVNNNEHTNNTRINKDIFGSINNMNNAVNENINCIDFNSNYIFNLLLRHYVMYSNPQLNGDIDLPPMTFINNDRGTVSAMLLQGILLCNINMRISVTKRS